MKNVQNLSVIDRKLSDINLELEDGLIRDQRDDLPYMNTAFFMNVTIKSVRNEKEFVWNVDLIYAFCENTIFMRDIILKNHFSLDYIIQIRYGESMGGSVLLGSWIRRCLKLCNTRYYIANPSYMNGREIGEIEEQKIEEFFSNYSLMDPEENEYERIHIVDAVKWSNHEDVFWYKLVQR